MGLITVKISGFQRNIEGSTIHRDSDLLEDDHRDRGLRVVILITRGPYKS